MITPFGTLSTREAATGIWIVIALMLVLSSKQARESFAGIVRAATHRKLLIPALMLAAYVALMVHVLDIAGLWEPELLKDTVLWFFVSGLALVFSSMNGAKQRGFWRKTIHHQLRAAVVVEYFVTTHTFSLLTEFLIIPISLVVGVFDAVAKSKPEFARVGRITTALLTVAGFVVFALALRGIGSLFTSEKTAHTLRGVVLAPLLSLIALPFAFVLALYALYDELTVRLSFGRSRSRALAGTAVRRIMWHCRFRPRRIAVFTARYRVEVLGFMGKPDITALLRRAII